MKIREVISREDKKQFLLLPVNLYRDVPQWIRPLDSDIESVFDPEKNKTYQQGECARWLLEDDAGNIIGRVASFVNKKLVNKGNDQPTGGMGFFECIENQAAAFMLFDHCKNWLQQRGMEAMDGPINFGNRDRWWGLLIEGFDKQPNYQINYNFPYYKTFFEAYGFQVYFYQLTFGRPIAGPLDEKLYAKARMIESNPDYRFEYLKKSQWGSLASMIKDVYNRAWANRGELPELTDASAKMIVKQMKPLLDERLLWFGFYKDEPIAFFLSLPEVNQIFKYLDGKLDWIGKIKFVWHRFRRTNKKACGVLFGVVPAHQGKGVDGAIIESFRRVAQVDDFPYKEYEMNWIGDFNPKMIRVVEQINVQVTKRHATYRKLFDETKPFKRYPILH